MNAPIKAFRSAAETINEIRQHPWSGDAGVAMLLTAVVATVPQRLGADPVPELWLWVFGAGALLSLMSLDLMPSADE